MFTIQNLKGLEYYVFLLLYAPENIVSIFNNVMGKRRALLVYKKMLYKVNDESVKGLMLCYGVVEVCQGADSAHT